MKTTITLETQRGPVAAEILDGGASVQLNVYLPPIGPAFFLAFPAGERQAAAEAAVALIDGDELPASTNITNRVPGALTAGTLTRVGFNVAFGTPQVDHAAEGA